MGDKVIVRPHTDNATAYRTFNGQHGVIADIATAFPLYCIGVRIINPERDLDDVYYFAKDEIKVLAEPEHVAVVTEQLSRLGHGDFVQVEMVDRNGNEGTIRGILYAPQSDGPVTILGVTLKDRNSTKTSKTVINISLLAKAKPLEPKAGKTVFANGRTWFHVKNKGWVDGANIWLQWSQVSKYTDFRLTV